MSTYRVGNHQPQNVYRGDQYIGVMFTAEDAALAVEALNGLHRYATTPDGDYLRGASEALAAVGRRLDRAAKPDEQLFAATIRLMLRDAAAELGVEALKPGRICDGSGRTCPRHGAVPAAPDPGPFGPVIDPCTGCGCAKAWHKNGRCEGDFLCCPCETWMPLEAQP